MDASRDRNLKRLQAGYAQLFERYPLPMLVVDLATLRLLAANDAAARCYGYSMLQLTDLHLPDIYFAQDHSLLASYLAQGAPQRAQQRRWRHRAQGGRPLEVEVDAEDMELHGLPTCMLLVTDVTPPAATAEPPAPVLAQLAAPERLQPMAEGFFMLDHGARFVQVNAHAERLLQVRREQLLGRTLWECCPRSALPLYRAHYQEVVHDRRAISCEFYLAHRQLWLEVRAFACSDGAVAYFWDVSAQHAHQEEQQQERERLNAIVNAIVNASSEAIISTDSAGRVQTFNPGAERVFAYRREYMLGKDMQLLLPQRHRQAYARQLAQFAASAEPPGTLELSRLQGLRSDGCEIDLEGSIVQVTIGQEKVLIATLGDVTARNRADAERHAARAQLSDLAQRLMSQEKELVKRVAQALHDQLGQTTAAIRIIHESMGVLRRGKESREYMRMDLQLGKLIDQATRQVRMVLMNLHPPLLDEYGLCAALDNELRSRALNQKSINFVLHVPPHMLEMRWPSALEYGAFMIAREAVENAIRHAQASVVTVSLEAAAEGTVLAVCDNGQGMSHHVQRKPGHLGITGMLERAHSIGSTVTLGPCEAGGTCVRLQWNASG